jgi:hypothetical protein
MAEFEFSQLDKAKPLELPITDLSPVYSFPQGKSYFAAIKLPEQRASNRMLLKIPTKGIFKQEVQLFCPTVTYLNESKAQLPNPVAARIYWQSPGWLATGFHYSVIEVPEEARYAVFHTDERAIGRMAAVPGAAPGYTFFNGSSYTYVPGGPNSGIPCGQQGSLEVEVR